MQQVKKKQNNQCNSTAGVRQQQHHPPSGHMNWNYSKDSSEGDINGVNFTEHEEYVLETITGKRGEDNSVARHHVTVTSTRSQSATKDFHDDPFFCSQDPSVYRQRSPSGSPSSPRNRSTSGHVTPPPNSRNRRTSTPPGVAGSISRTSSRHSKSSSDGSFDTPAPSSPPHGAGAMHSKPPHARSSPGPKTRRKGEDRDGKVVESGAFYQNPWFCGFTDAFEGFEAFQNQK